jgi:predicted ATPase
MVLRHTRINVITGATGSGKTTLIMRSWLCGHRQNTGRC